MASIKYLLDTNILSEVINPSPSLSVMQCFAQHRQALAISTVTWHELNYGAHLMNDGRKKRNLQKYLSDVIEAYFPIYDYDKKAASWHAAQRARLKQIGVQTSYPDGQIAAIAATHGLIVVTRNTQDFLHFEEVALENWFNPLPNSDS